VVVANPDYIIGAWDVKPTSGQLIISMARGYVPLYPRGGKFFQDADDCAIGHILVFEKGRPGRRYLLGTENLSYREFMGKIARALGRRAPLLPVPNLAMRAAGLAGAVGARFDEHRFAGLNGDVLRQMQQERYRSARRSWDELGVPRNSIDGAVEKAVRWFRDNGYFQR
jgi:dihydroflavonol-4-reductase